jgi:predicted lipoprotein with Yx(FWY)xxD motif
LVDSSGRTVYLFEKDPRNRSACFGACAAAWPPVRAAKPLAGSGLSADKLGTIKRADGGPQVTYNGHPLYRFASDQKPGDAMGQGIDGFGAEWYVLSPAGKQVETSGSNGDAADADGGSGY